MKDRFVGQYIAYRDRVLEAAKRRGVESPSEQEAAALYVAGVDWEAALSHCDLARRLVKAAAETRRP
jgi:hypothetical protein